LSATRLHSSSRASNLARRSALTAEGGGLIGYVLVKVDR
jgi:hypothetical protein